MGVLFQLLSVIAFTAWGLYLWIDVKNYGSQPNCNDQIKYVVLFFTVKATEPWLRGLWIATIVLSAVGLMITFVAKAWKLIATKLVEEEEQAETKLTRGLTPTETPTLPHAETVKGKEETSEKPWYIYVSIPLFLSAIYSTIMLELTVRRNASTGSGVVQIDNSWEFGQVLSFVMIFANVNEAVHFLFGYFGRRSLDRKREAQIEEVNSQEDRYLAPSSRQSRPSESNVSARDQPANSISSGYELPDRRNAEVSENSQSQYQPVAMLQ